ncbi:MAG: ABC transporter permease, partial [Dietzia sp.]
MTRRLRERRADLARLTARRAAAAPLVLLAVTIGAFVLAAASPLNPLAAHFGSGYERTTGADRSAAAAALGTDLPWWQAWWGWVGGLAAGDAGFSHTYRQPVAEVLMERLPWTILLSATALALALVGTLLA